MGDDAEQQSDPALLQPGEVVGGKYIVRRLLGRGGMGAVYLAEHDTLGTPVALKLLSRSTEVLQARFLREARILASLRSEHVAKVADFGVFERLGAAYMVMEYLPGRDLGQVLDARAQPLPVGEAVDHVLEVCESLVEAHAAGVVHRDIKPSNLFLTSRIDGSPTVKVLDFGIAKIGDEGEAKALTATSMVFGSPAYMSPEQIRSSKQVGPQTDVWSLALVLYELVSKSLPFKGDGPTSIVASIVVDKPVPLDPSIGPHLWMLLEPALHKEPEHRVPSVVAFANSLLPFAGERGRVALGRISRMSGARAISDHTLQLSDSMRPKAVSRPEARLASDSSPQAFAPTVVGAITADTPASARTLNDTQPSARRKTSSRAFGLAAAALALCGLGIVVGARSRQAPAEVAHSLSASAPATPLPAELPPPAAPSASSPPTALAATSLPVVTEPPPATPSPAASKTGTARPTSKPAASKGAAVAGAVAKPQPATPSPKPKQNGGQGADDFQ